MRIESDAISLEGLGRLDEAVVELEECIKRSPYDAALWRALGEAQSATGAPGRAFAAYVRSVGIVLMVCPGSIS